MTGRLPVLLAAVLVVVSGARADRPDAESYDFGLCERAQRLLVNADETAFAVRVLRGEGDGFHTIQMDVDGDERTVVVAASVGRSGPLATHVACKMVDRDRINDVLGLALGGPAHQCADVNAYTYQVALDSLSPGERARYEKTQRPLRFGPDVVLASGGEWLPAAVDTDVRPAPEGGLSVRAPSIRVPWDRQARNFFQGTQHCKLITLAAMRRWMLAGAPAGDAVLFPASKVACAAPVRPTSDVGSCLFYFAPAGTRFCEDYTGSQWTQDSARAACARRHASAEALRVAQNRYAGAGGVFSTQGCTARADAGRLGGTCVFHCNAGDETLWRSVDSPDGSAAAGMMTRACDLYIP